MSTAQYIENCFQLGMIVDALNYIIDETFHIIDPSKISYNEWYSQSDYILSKYPKGLLETEYVIPVLKDLIESKKGQTPLSELEKIYLNNSNK